MYTSYSLRMPVVSSTTPPLGYPEVNYFVKTWVPDHDALCSILRAASFNLSLLATCSHQINSFQLSLDPFSLARRFGDLLVIPQHGSRFLGQSISLARYQLRYLLIVFVCGTIRLQLLKPPAPTDTIVLSFCKARTRNFLSISTMDDLLLLLLRNELIFCSPDLISSRMAPPILDEVHPSTTEEWASFVQVYVQERLCLSCLNSVNLHSFTYLKFPPEHRTVHFTIDYPLGITIIHPISNPRQVSVFEFLCFTCSQSTGIWTRCR
jgi:hypothetical protein